MLLRTVFTAMVAVTKATAFVFLAQYNVQNKQTTILYNNVGHSGGMANTRNPDSYEYSDARKSIISTPTFDEYMKTREATEQVTATAVAGTTLSSPAAPIVSFSSLHNDGNAADVTARTPTSKLENAAIQRFTVTYDKLCKNCPTRLEPRVETITEMILGLPLEERQRLMMGLEKRFNADDEKHNNRGSVRSSQEVYAFQTKVIEGRGAFEESSESSMRDEEEKIKSVLKDKLQMKVAAVDKEIITTSKVNAKLLKKMNEARAKCDSNRHKLSKVKRLLLVTNALLSKELHDPDIYASNNPLDSNWYHNMKMLKNLTGEELKMEQLKLMVQKTKYESKVAKARLKMHLRSIEG